MSKNHAIDFYVFHIEHIRTDKLVLEQTISRYVFQYRLNQPKYP